jgi:hypothetical protein
MKKLLLFIFWVYVYSVNAQEPIILHASGLYDTWFEDTMQYANFLLDTTNVWHIGEPGKDLLTYPEGNKALYTDTNTYYQSNIRASTQIKIGLNQFIPGVPDAEGIIIEFDHKYDFEENKDGGIVEISYDNGESWNNILLDPLIQNNLFDLSNFYNEDDIVSSYNNQPGFTGFTSQIISSLLDFSIKDEYDLDTLLIRFTCSTDDVNSSNEGWIIERFNIQGYTFNNVKQVNNRLYNIRTYYDPAENLLVFSSEYKLTEIKLISSVGDVLAQEKGFDIKILDISNIYPGIYILTCKNDKNIIQTLKIVKP